LVVQIVVAGTVDNEQVLLGRSTTEMPVYNPNYVGKDIVTGAKDIRQLVFGPKIIAIPQ
jgi:hypothetical protein